MRLIPQAAMLMRLGLSHSSCRFTAAWMKIDSGQEARLSFNVSLYSLGLWIRQRWSGFCLFAHLLGIVNIKSTSRRAALKEYSQSILILELTWT